MAAKDEQGNRYGRLVVLSRTENNARGDAQWVCHCDCGNTIITKGVSLRSGHTKSCGCLQKDKVGKQGVANTADLLGRSFGKLTVYKRIQGRTNAIGKWVCHCECGGETITTSNKLISGHTQSCGCIMSKQVELIASLLKKASIKFEKEYAFVDLKSSKNYALRFDFAIFGRKRLICLIEYDGEQHSNTNHFFWNKTVPVNDKLKNDYCIANNIHLYRISYLDNTSKVLIDILEQEKLLK